MASNPMQKKTRTAFLLGFMVMLIIAVIVGGVIFFITSRNKKKEESKPEETYVYRLKTDVKSGESITEDMVTSVLVNKEAVPNSKNGGAFTAKTQSKDKDGNVVWKDVPCQFLEYKPKIDLTAGTIVTENMLYKEKALESDERIVEYNVLQLPVQVSVSEFVDVRFLLSNGQDYIVVSHKEVKDVTGDTIWLQLSEHEILLMSNAIVEAAISPATNLYITKYVEPGNQDAASITYVPSYEVINLIANDPNVIESAKETLKSRYQGFSSLTRGAINNEINKYSADALDNIEAGMIAARERAAEARQEYLYGVN